MEWWKQEEFSASNVEKGSQWGASLADIQEFVEAFPKSVKGAPWANSASPLLPSLWGKVYRGGGINP